MAFNCALLTLSDWDALGPGTRIRLLLVDCSDKLLFFFAFLFFYSLCHGYTVKLHYIHRSGMIHEKNILTTQLNNCGFEQCGSSNVCL